jgi:hypothetical protein
MDTRKEHIEKLVIKLKVLESKILHLESLTDEVIHDIESEFQEQLKVLLYKKEAGQQKLLKLMQDDGLE